MSVYTLVGAKFFCVYFEWEFVLSCSRLFWCTWIAGTQKKLDCNLTRIPIQSIDRKTFPLLKYTRVFLAQAKNNFYYSRGFNFFLGEKNSCVLFSRRIFSGQKIISTIPGFFFVWKLGLKVLFGDMLALSVQPHQPWQRETLTAGVGRRIGEPQGLDSLLVS